MAESAAKLLGGLRAASLVVTMAMEPGASTATKQAAVRSMIKALEKLINDEALQERLYTCFPRRERAELAQDVLCPIADMLTEQYAVLLLRAGYRSPPPPPAYKLVEQTREAVLRPPYGRLYGPDHVEAVFCKVREYLAELRKHLADTRLKQIQSTVLTRLRPLGGGLLLLLSVLDHVEVTMGGSEFDFSVHLSTQDNVSVEVTIPFNLDELVFRSAIVSASLTAVDKEVSEARGELRELERTATTEVVDAAREALEEADEIERENHWSRDDSAVADDHDDGDSMGR